MDAIFRVLPTHMKDLLQGLSKSILEETEEIRLRVNRPIEVSSRGIPHFLPYLFTKSDAEQLISKLANHSFYTLDEELKEDMSPLKADTGSGLPGKPFWKADT